ncbi:MULTISPECIES: hypothetical protein [Bacteroidota]|uniref:hypothetical protein n=1 Tax=Bacteroidota TaxID=976 RepID=UPI00289E9C8D|nr:MULTISPECIES: hypothetical protein [Bacteroidota]
MMAQNSGYICNIASSAGLISSPKKWRRNCPRIEKEKQICSMPWSIHFVRFFQDVLPIGFFEWFVSDVMGFTKQWIGLKDINPRKK